MKIGFKNFKRFQDFPMIELSPITFLVGPNNSGKSSFIKAFTFLFSNLENQPKVSTILPPFITQVSFYHNGIANYGWGDFSTTLNKNQDSHEISYNWELRDTLFKFSFGASKEEILDNPSLLVTLPIKTFVIKNHKLGIIIENSLNDDKWSTVCKIDSKILQEWLSRSMLWLENRIQRRERLSQKVSAIFRNFESWDRTRNLSYNDKIEDQINEYKQAENSIKEKGINGYILFKYNSTSPQSSPIKSKILRDYCDYCVNYIAGNRLGKSLISPNFVYIETHNAPHSLAIKKDDKNSFLAQTVVDFYSKVSRFSDSSIYPWIVKWMEKFEIGRDFEIETHFGGEIYTVNIVKKDESMPLGTLGTGAIQMFILLLKLATILTTIGDYANIVVLIEEPEQNLHPKLQSKLAELFLDVYRQTNGRVNFIIETHSEYLIRRTQVLVAKKEYSMDDNDALEMMGNPFKVYFFQEKGLPYDMGYQPNGKFIEDFGTGFCDEACKQSIELFEVGMK